MYVSDFDRLSSGQIKIWCNTCETSTWHVKNKRKKYRKGFSPIMETFYTCEVCKNISLYFNSGYDTKYAMHLYKKNNVRVTCPKCHGRFFYSYKFKASKCKKCGFELPLNAVIEI